MRINDTEFDVSLKEILDELTSQLRANNIQYLQKTVNTTTDIQVCCPYHNNGMERRPSAGIRKSDGLFHCFACGAVHSLPEVISYCFGYENDLMGATGWRWLIRNFSTIRVEERKDVELDLERNQTDRKFRYTDFAADRSSVVDNSVDRNNQKYVTEEELNSYRYIHPYMYKRKLTDEIIELFDIGYDKNTQCITFPIRDIYGNCLFIARRSVHTKYFNYPSGAEKPLYGVYELIQTNKHIDTIIICESMLDALTCWVYGKYAVALNGLGNELQFNQLRHLPFRKYILATDNDKSGMAARSRIRKNVPNKIITEFVLPDDKKDINELEKLEFDNLQEVF